MKVLLTGSTGYIGRRLLPVLVKEGHHVTCIVRDSRRFDWSDFSEKFLENVTVIEADFSQSIEPNELPTDIEAAYYLIHSLTQSYESFEQQEKCTAYNFASYISTTSCQQIIYLGGISNADELSKHLASRQNVEEQLRTSKVPVTVLRAAVIIGSGSASFEIIRDLVEKLPVMIAPKWLKSKCQPIAIRNVIEYLMGVLHHEACYHQVFDIGGPDVLTYKEMLLQYGKSRRLKRTIITLPVLTPKLSSLWLYFVTSTAYTLASKLVDSMKNDVVVKNHGIRELVSIQLLSYAEALEKAFSKINQKNVISSWKDAITHHHIDKNFLDYVDVPRYGCFRDTRTVEFHRETSEVLNNVWQIGGKRGWYFGNTLWKIRGFLDQLIGGVGLRRGRRSQVDLKAGDSLDFWRVLLADSDRGHLLLYAEMKLPGEAWLEFKINETPTKKLLLQRATFRPLGLWGRLYWYLVLPFHFLIFPKMAQNIVKY
ncbi:SDR family oxidoreductase [Fulvivirga sp. M361]|uniref:SDR family oxidoreductase n=1 Tax=Fulvivirga sp. M361 TaxID=2594266 RepID=UPI00117AD7DD|nr:SDR family oxidoreductase [Fulvivirga sp. M361]TRX57547.1 SDR family oxidoreductase [Fulvivirga sp. M361]